MTKHRVFRGSLAALVGIVLCTLSFSSAAAQQEKLRIIQTNSAGDNIHIIDPATKCRQPCQQQQVRGLTTLC